jgi:hypothetical protein
MSIPGCKGCRTIQPLKQLGAARLDSCTSGVSKQSVHKSATPLTPPPSFDTPLHQIVNHDGSQQVPPRLTCASGCVHGLPAAAPPGLMGWSHSHSSEQSVEGTAGGKEPGVYVNSITDYYTAVQTL